MSTLRLIHRFVITAFVLLLVGCGSGPKPYNIEVTLAESLRDRTIYVHLVALNETDGQMLSGADMTEYWEPNSSLMNDLNIYKITFLEGQSHVHTLSRTDPIWDEWNDETNLYVLADLPGSSNHQHGQDDRRRLILPLDSSRWNGDTIQVLVNKSFVTHTSTLLPDSD